MLFTWSGIAIEFGGKFTPLDSLLDIALLVEGVDEVLDGVESFLGVLANTAADSVCLADGVSGVAVLTLMGSDQSRARVTPGLAAAVTDSTEHVERLPEVGLSSGILFATERHLAEPPVPEGFSVWIVGVGGDVYAPFEVLPADWILVCAKRNPLERRLEPSGGYPRTGV